MRRFWIAIGMVAVIAVFVAWNRRPAALPVLPPHKFNVILISVDSLRSDHMGLYGYKRNTTPNIDAWAKDAAVFDNYFSTSFLTPISEASVHTGDYPFTNGVINFESELRDSVPTIAQILKKNGWQTATFTSSPEFTVNPALKASFIRGFDTAITYVYATSSRPYDGRQGDPVPGAITWMDGHSADPFFLWLSIGTVHWPYGQGEPDHFSDPSYDGIFRINLTKNKNLTWHDSFAFVYKGIRYSSTVPIRPIGTVDQKDINYINGRYDDGLALADRMLGKLFDYLKKKGLADNTVVIFESEHGETLGERGYIAHYDIYDETTHVPLIIKASALSAQRVKTLTSGVDVLPTVLSLLHVPAPKMDGVDVLPYITGAASAPPRQEVYIARIPLWERLLSSESLSDMPFVTAATPVWAQYVRSDNDAHYHDMAIRTDKWKLIHRLAREAFNKYSWWGWITWKPIVLPEYELYDIAADPGEINNIYEAHAGDADVSALRKKLNTWEDNMQKIIPGPTHAQEIQPYF